MQQVAVGHKLQKFCHFVLGEKTTSGKVSLQGTSWDLITSGQAVAMAIW
jgi:hypothetical protein